ncbi:MAG TPA: hypothetical protein VGP96_01505 [Candidatus Dormibacteraeota bacterium]|jgi:hypothetical protein|nr:hypothetical protein [Candidatus Dormibacteraeota bacterium]
MNEIPAAVDLSRQTLEQLQRQHPGLGALLRAYRERRREYDALFPGSCRRDPGAAHQPAQRRYRV